MGSTFSYSDEWDRRHSAYGMGQLRVMGPARPGECARKKRLALVAAARAVWEHLPFPTSRSAVEAAERYADDARYPDIEWRCRAARQAARRAEQADWVRGGRGRRAGGFTRLSPTDQQATRTARTRLAWVVTRIAQPGGMEDDDVVPEWIDVLHTLSNLWPELGLGSGKEADDRHAHLLWDVFSNPFRPVAFDPEWRTVDAVAVARGMYEARDFSAMPILADALQDAGCGEEQVLRHCRGPGPHVRGCWVVDLVLGKE